ncbi:MAG: insulinase family protein [Chloroflexi bacterium]|nr:insulinase family protein [Chloroflexota bacterium]
MIVEELNMTKDYPTYQADLLLDEVMWPDQPLGRDVGGTKESVEAISRETLLELMGSQYIPGNTVVAVAGEVEHEEVVSSMESHLKDWRGKKGLPWTPAKGSQQSPSLKLGKRKTDQAHMVVGLRGLSSTHPDRYALGLLSAILGEGMSSRLFLEVREKRGLAYDVHSSVSHYRDAGALTVYAGTDPKKAKDALEVILQELDRLRDGVPVEELNKAKELSKGRLWLRMEDTRSVTSWLAGQELLTGRVLTVDQAVEIVDFITPEDLQRVARQLIVNQGLNLAVVGPFRSEQPFLRRLKL